MWKPRPRKCGICPKVLVSEPRPDPRSAEGHPRYWPLGSRVGEGKPTWTCPRGPSCCWTNLDGTTLNLLNLVESILALEKSWGI